MMLEKEILNDFAVGEGRQQGANAVHKLCFKKRCNRCETTICINQTFLSVEVHGFEF
jgi:hypothetical protein